MLHTVDVGEFSLASYRGVAPEEVLDALAAVAARLRGLRVLHLNATPYGGGVSELLRSAVPLCNDLDIPTRWKIIAGNEAFFTVTKKMHNALQGAASTPTPAERRVYEDTSRRNAAMLGADADFDDFDVVVAHDPQPSAIRSFVDSSPARWVWRCHIDTAEPDPHTWSYLRDFVLRHDRTVFTSAEFVPPDLPAERVRIMPPAIDPLSPKNMPLDRATAASVLNWIGIEADRPLVTQVSRFDPWKDPLGVIRAYRLARAEVPGLQLALVGSMALDDPEAWEIYREITAVSDNDPDVHVFTNLTGVGNVEVNAFQRLSGVMVQKSLREGFGLVVSESLWKGTPVVAGRAGGIPLQMADGAGGLLVDSVEECAAGMVALLADPDRARALGAAGQERVRRHFLLPRLLLDELTMLDELVNGGPADQRVDQDPCCGISLPAGLPALTADVDGHHRRFCSRQCRDASVGTATSPRKVG
ncbi:glycosyltransferase [Streptoalloteichus hindustanus]|uniref:Trehalose synthase (ADP-glucose) n=1 Tax=Streptoalloteichus hindustanus TaxID=2017 RepID=A0A1M5DU43_STRHI|nr:glycosyltransferase [Streptoalloteichus hindustanus]SHF70513.1 trehalose synthase (ADP-glucose) [Streptoalloteichus hindustanus]